MPAYPSKRSSDMAKIAKMRAWVAMDTQKVGAQNVSDASAATATASRPAASALGTEPEQAARPDQQHRRHHREHDRHGQVLAEKRAELVGQPDKQRAE